MKTTLLRATRGDFIATGVIAAVSALAIGGVWLTADIRGVEHSPASNAYENSEVLTKLDGDFSEQFRLNTAKIPGIHRPQVAGNLLITPTSNGVIATNDAGEQVWSYHRSDAPLCSLGTAWDKVVLTFKTGVGCGDVVSLHANSGKYADTRSANSSEEVVAISSNDRVGTVSNDRVELWRSDLVRTVEYGNVEAKQEAEHQPHEDCTINSALTRTELLAVVETCPDESNKSWLRLQKVTPEDSRKPEMEKDIALDSSGARLIAVSQDAAAVFIPEGSPRIESYNKSGAQLSSVRVNPSPTVSESTSPFAPATADLPHHMTWFDGARLYLLNPATLKVEHIFEDAIGTGIAIDDHLVIPTKEGLREVDWNTGKSKKDFKVDRGDYSGPVSIQRFGQAIAEKRGDETVVLR